MHPGEPAGRCVFWLLVTGYSDRFVAIKVCTSTYDIPYFTVEVITVSTYIFIKLVLQKNLKVQHVLDQHYEIQTTISGALNYVASLSGTHTFL